MERSRGVNITMTRKLILTLAGSGCITAGVILFFCVSQILWLVSAHNRAESYAVSILNHSESIAKNLTSTLDKLNNLQGAICTPADLNSLKVISYDSRFVKDAGRIIDGNIICSAMWGNLPSPFHLQGDGLVTKNNVRLWNDVSSYFPSSTTLDISAKNKSFVVTSPTAFTRYESYPDELSAQIKSHDSSVMIHSFGGATNKKKPAQAVNTTCSDKYDICVHTKVDANIFAKKFIDILIIIGLLGACFGLLFFYTTYQFLRSKESLTYRLKNAIKNEIPFTAYQPIVHGNTGDVSGFEVLARWQDKKLGSISPELFIKKAEELGLSEQLNKIIIKKALKECSNELVSNPDLYLSFNIGTNDLLKGSLVSYLSEQAKVYHIMPNQIAVEILEGATAEISKIEEKIAVLRSAGHKVLIDDFGSGYSSLSYLAKLNIDILKVDKSFTQAAGTNSPAAIVLQKVYEIAKILNAKIIFEGVETESQKNAILAFCPDALLQGWLFSKALSITELTKKIQSQTTLGRPINFAHD